VKRFVLAAMRLPLTAQRILASNPDPVCRTALAASPHTDPAVLATLARDRVPGVRRFAHLRTDDVGLLREELGRTDAGLCTPYAARNPLAPADLLAAALGSDHAQTALGAWVNPSTPEDARRKLTPSRASEIALVGGSNHDRVVRAHELAANNAWMLEDAGAWDGNVRRALAGLPQATEAQLAAITAAGRSGSAAVRRHPVRCVPTERPACSWSTAELAAHGAPATDMLAMARTDFDASAARTVVNRRGADTAEPHVIGRIVNRFGAEALEHATLPAIVLWSGTRFNAASWVAPIMGYLTFDMPNEWESFRPAIARLGDDRTAWETFIRLVDDSWQGTPEEAAEAALNL